MPRGIPIRVLVKHGMLQLPMYDDQGALMNPDVFEMKPCWRGVKWKPEIRACPKYRGVEYEAIENDSGVYVCYEKNVCPKPENDGGSFCI